MPEFMGETWFMVVMGVALLGLIGLLLFLRNRQSSDDE
jgi:LPXTG-motif cell wall-anchored protein